MKAPRVFLSYLIFFLCCSSAAFAQGQPAKPASWVVVGAQVADGTGKPLRRVNVRVEGDTIVRVGNFQPKKGEQVVRADGLVLAPGFIDPHNHSTEGLEVDPLAESQISQGITTLLLGQDGDSPWPIAEYLAKRRKDPPALNVVMLVGHATVRRKVMGDDYKRAARPDEIAAMEKLVEQGMREGAIGLSSGLEYEVGSYATTDEVVALARVAGRHGGFYISHIRDEADRTLDAVRECIAIGERAKIPVQITHIKVGTVGVWGKSGEVVRMIEEARRRGVDVTADCYPYTAWHSTITVLVPNKQYEDPPSVERAIADVGGAGNITITECKAHPDYEMRTMEEIARARGITPVQLFIEIVRDGGADIIGHSMREDDMRTFYAQPWVMVSSDGGIGMRHPRATGTFPKVLGEFVREKKWLALPEAIRKMTSLTAARLKLRDRGQIRKGMKADLVLLDPARVRDRSTFQQPELLSEGIEKVWVNGVLVWDCWRGSGNVLSKCEPTGARPGRVLSTLGGRGDEQRPRQQTSFQAEGGVVERPASLPDTALNILAKDDRVQVCLQEKGLAETSIFSWFLASEIDLNDDNLVDLVVLAKEPCLFGANVDPFWVLRKTKRGYELALRVVALGLDILDTRTGGYRDISASAVVGAREVRTAIFEFDGKKYQARSRP